MTDAQDAAAVSMAVGQLDLDGENPRLPERLRDANQQDLLRYFEDEYELEELGWSMAEKGYFEVEPLLAIAHPRDARRRIIIEGNRRLATLQLLTNAEKRRLSRRENFWSELAALAEGQRLDPVPVRTYGLRDELLEYLGFRHVSGLLQWTAEAKARFVRSLIRDHEYSFADAAKVIGSRADAIRRQYIAWQAIEQAKAAGVDVQPAVDHFGVFYRALQNPGIRTFIEIDGWLDGTEDLIEPLGGDGVARLSEFIGFVFGQDRVLRDSRDLDNLGRILGDTGATAVLRDTRDLRVAADEIPADRQAIYAAIRGAYRQAARANAEAWQFAGDRELAEETRRLRGIVEQLQRSLDAGAPTEPEPR